MQGNEACRRVEFELRRALDELRQCRDGEAPATTWGAQHLAMATEAAPPQHLAFPSGVLEELAAIAARHDPDSDAAGACVFMLHAVGYPEGARRPREQVLQSKPALRCARTRQGRNAAMGLAPARSSLLTAHLPLTQLLF